MMLSVWTSEQTDAPAPLSLTFYCSPILRLKTTVYNPFDAEQHKNHKQYLE